MAVQRPRPDDLTEIARQFHFGLAPERMPAFEALVEGFLAPYDRLDELEEPRRRPRWPRDGGAAPRPEENRFGAWAWRVRIEGAADGPLAGRTVAIKDNVAVAGVPMSNGTALLDGHVPAEDATVVERVLDAGGTILGKAVCESLCFSGGSHTADSGPVRNPMTWPAPPAARRPGATRAGRCGSRAAGRVSTA
jgi:amidase